MATLPHVAPLMQVNIGPLLQGIAALIGIALTIVVVLWSVFHSIGLRRQLSPRLKLTIGSKWLDDENVVLKLKVQNVSEITASRLSFHLQVLLHKCQDAAMLSEWVAFRKEDQRRGEHAYIWSDPVEVLESTITVLSDEVITVDRKVSCPRGCLLHVGFQARRSSRILPKLRRWWGYLISSGERLGLIKPESNEPLSVQPANVARGFVRQRRGDPFSSWFRTSWTATSIVYPMPKRVATEAVVGTPGDNV